MNLLNSNFEASWHFQWPFIWFLPRITWCMKVYDSYILAFQIQGIRKFLEFFLRVPAGDPTVFHSPEDFRSALDICRFKFNMYGARDLMVFQFVLFSIFFQVKSILFPSCSEETEANETYWFINISISLIKKNRQRTPSFIILDYELFFKLLFYRY